MKINKRITAATIAALALMGGLSPSANALMMEISSMSTNPDGTANVETISVTDGGAGDSFGAIEGAISYLGSVGDFGVNAVTGVSKPLVGLPENGELDLGSLNVSSIGVFPSTLTIKLTETGFMSNVGIDTFWTEVGGTTKGSNVTFEYFVDDSNAAFGTAQQISSFDFSTSPYMGTASGAADLTDLFSMTIVATITHTGAGQTTSFDAYMLPEPSTLALMGLGLVAFGFQNRKRIKDRQ